MVQSTKGKGKLIIDHAIIAITKLYFVFPVKLLLSFPFKFEKLNTKQNVDHSHGRSFKKRWCKSKDSLYITTNVGTIH